jgi:hypothetical protein
MDQNGRIDGPKWSKRWTGAVKEALGSLLLLQQLERRLETNTRAQWKLLHTWMILVTVKQHLVQNGQIDGPNWSNR